MGVTEVLGIVVFSFFVIVLFWSLLHQKTKYNEFKSKEEKYADIPRAGYEDNSFSSRLFGTITILFAISMFIIGLITGNDRTFPIFVLGSIGFLCLYTVQLRKFSMLCTEDVVAAVLDSWKLNISNYNDGGTVYKYHSLIEYTYGFKTYKVILCTMKEEFAVGSYLKIKVNPSNPIQVDPLNVEYLKKELE